MTRSLAALAVLLGLAPLAQAQDMPLSQILIDGEGWKKAEGKPEKPNPPDMASHMTLSPDRSTAFLCLQTGQRQFLYAGPVTEDGVSVNRLAPYAPLRTRRGEKGIEVGGLATDRDGRIYAATEIGVQVFDPTGRLCGVMTPAAPGKPELMAFEGDQLTLWIGDVKYTRKLNTTGVK
jgi:hypothetical protein